MKKFMLLMVLMSLQALIIAQPLMKVKEVFDFNIGDSFQITGSASNGQTPNADRIDIIDKYYSSGNDTLFYERYHHSYYSCISWEGGPHFIYTFYQFTDTVWYTNLGADISAYDTNFYFSNLYNGPEAIFCDSMINGYQIVIGPGFENEIHTVKYGKGLGMVYYEIYNEMTLGYPRRDKLTYYKKGDNYCGIPDLTSSDKVEKIQDVQVFPNPAVNYINYFNLPANPFTDFEIINTYGQVVKNGNSNKGFNQIEISALEKGIYFLRLIRGTDISISKFIK